MLRSERKQYAIILSMINEDPMLVAKVDQSNLRQLVENNLFNMKTKQATGLGLEFIEHYLPKKEKPADKPTKEELDRADEEWDGNLTDCDCPEEELIRKNPRGKYPILRNFLSSDEIKKIKKLIREGYSQREAFYIVFRKNKLIVKGNPVFIKRQSKQKKISKQIKSSLLNKFIKQFGGEKFFVEEIPGIIRPNIKITLVAISNEKIRVVYDLDGKIIKKVKGNLIPRGGVRSTKTGRNPHTKRNPIEDKDLAPVIAWILYLNSNPSHHEAVPKNILEVIVEEGLYDKSNYRLTPKGNEFVRKLFGVIKNPYPQYKTNIEKMIRELVRKGYSRKDAKDIAYEHFASKKSKRISALPKDPEKMYRQLIREGYSEEQAKIIAYPKERNPIENKDLAPVVAWLHYLKSAPTGFEIVPKDILAVISEEGYYDKENLQVSKKGSEFLQKIGTYNDVVRNRVPVH